MSLTIFSLAVFGVISTFSFRSFSWWAPVRNKLDSTYDILVRITRFFKAKITEGSKNIIISWIIKTGRDIAHFTDFAVAGIQHFRDYVRAFVHKMARRHGDNS